MTSHRVNHIVAGFVERVHFKVATDNVQDKYNGEWGDGYFMRVITRSFDYLVAQGDQIYKCPTIRRRVAADAYTDMCLDGIKVDFYEYSRKGAVASTAEAIRGDWRERSDVPKTLEKAFQARFGGFC